MKKIVIGLSSLYLAWNYYNRSLGVLIVLVQALTGDVTWTEFLQSDMVTQLLGLLGIVALRAGVSKAQITV